MSTLKDIIDIIKSSKATEDLKNNMLNKKYSSISTRASEGTLQFPILISNSLDIETAQMVVKALERNYTTFVQTVISMNSVTSSTDIADYLKQFHQNFSNNKLNISDVTDIIKNIGEGYKIEKLDNGTYVLTETYNNTSTSGTIKANKEQLIDLMEDLNYNILNKKVTPRDETIYHFKDAEKNKKFNSITMEATSYRPLTDDQVQIMLKSRGYFQGTAAFDRARAELMQQHYDDYVRQREIEDEEKLLNHAEKRAQMTMNQAQREIDNIRNDENDEYRRQRDRLDDLRQYNKFEYEKTRNATNDAAKNANLASQTAANAKNIQATDYKLNSYELPTQMLKDNDVKKANELIATTMHVRLHMLNKNNDPIGIRDFILGIKGNMHPIKSEEMIANVSNACKNTDKVFNFLRWTTGEISFFKDFYLNINDMKKDVYNESQGASRWWIALKNRRSLGKMSNSAFIKNKILPNATIVLSTEEAEIIKSVYGFDIMKPYFTSKIMKEYYLLGFVVVDNSAQIAHFMFDGDVDFQSVSFSGMEKENTRDERKFKEMLKVINRN